MPARRQVAVYGGSFNPPGLHHLRVAEVLLEAFDAVLVIPCGGRPDKPESARHWLEPALRQQAVELTFAPLAAAGRLAYNWSDLASPRFLPTVELAACLSAEQPDDELWFVAGADLFAGGERGDAEIQRSWKEGPRIWSELAWACLERPGHPADPADLPPRHRLVHCAIPGSSSEIRRRLAEGGDLTGLVAPGVAALLAAAACGCAGHDPHAAYLGRWRDAAGRLLELHPGPAGGLAARVSQPARPDGTPPPTRELPAILEPGRLRLELGRPGLGAALELVPGRDAAGAFLVPNLLIGLADDWEADRGVPWILPLSVWRAAPD